MKKYNLNLNDIEFVAFRRQKSAGGQNANKTSTSIRATHIPTGIRVEASVERSQTANKKAAIAALQEKLDNLMEEKLGEAQRRSYDSKANSTFASQIRTYRLCGNAQGVLDHRSGINHSNSEAVLNGELDSFIIGALRAGI